MVHFRYTLLPKLYLTNHPTAPWLIKWTDLTERQSNGKPRERRERFSPTRETDARKRLAELTRLAANVGTAGLAFDARQRADFFSARQILDAHGHGRVALASVVEDWLRSHPAQAKAGVPLAPLLQQFLTEKASIQNRRPQTLRTLRARCTAWLRDQELVWLSEVTKESVGAVLARPRSPLTRLSDLTAVSSFCTWLVQRGHLADNPAKQLVKPSTDVRAPRVLSAKQAQALLEAARTTADGRLLRYLTLCLLAGLRPGEAATQDPAQVRVDATQPVVRVSTGKRRRRVRVVALSSSFLAWWRIAPEIEPICKWSRDRTAFDKVRATAGITAWQADIMRHTWISMRMELTQDEHRVAMEAGTSPAMIHAHYLSLIDRAEAEALESLRPKPQHAAKRVTAEKKAELLPV